MDKSQSQVKQWHQKFGVPSHSSPQISIHKDRALLRARLIYEEAVETIEALGCAVINDPDAQYGQTVELCAANEFDLAKVVDGLFDLRFVCDGTAEEIGVDMEPACDEGFDSNMTKMWTWLEWKAAMKSGRAASEGLYCEDTDENGVEEVERCLVVRRKDFKIVKPVGYRPADFRKVIDAQIEAARK